MPSLFLFGDCSQTHARNEIFKFCYENLGGLLCPALHSHCGAWIRNIWIRASHTRQWPRRNVKIAWVLRISGTVPFGRNQQQGVIGTIHNRISVEKEGALLLFISLIIPPFPKKQKREFP